MSENIFEYLQVVKSGLLASNKCMPSIKATAN